MITQSKLRGEVIEASEAGFIVVVNKFENKGVTLSVVDEMLVPGGLFRHLGKRFIESSVKAFDHAVGLRVKGFGELVGDVQALAQLIQGVFS